MILKLKNFGHFSEAEFEIKPLTLFYGPNESGKTTILDAMLSAFVKISGTTIYGKILNKRYQKDRITALDIPQIEVQPNLILNSLVIREGQMSIDHGDTLLNKSIQESLFDSGFNPGELKKLAESFSQTSGSTKSAREFKKKELDFKTKKDECDLAERELNEISSSFSNLPKMELVRLELTEKSQTLNSELTALNQNSNELTERESYAKADEIYSQILHYEELEIHSKSDETFLSLSYEEKANKYSVEEKSLNDRILDLKNTKKEKEAQISLQKNEISRKESLFAKMSEFSNFFESWKNKIYEIKNTAPSKTKTSWNLGYVGIFVSFLLGAVGFSIWVSLAEKEHYLFLISAVLLIVSVFFLLRAKTQESFLDEDLYRKKISELIQSISSQSLGEINFFNLSLDVIQSKILEMEREYTKSHLELSSLKKDLILKEEDLTLYLEKEKKLQFELTETINNLKKIFEETKVRDLRSLAELHHEVKFRRSELKKLAENLTRTAKEFGAKDSLDLKRRLKEKISEWEKLGLSKDFSNEERLLKQKITSEISLKQNELKSLEQKLQSLSSEILELKVRLESKVLPACENWERKKKEFSKAEKDLEKVVLDLKSFEMLTSIFASMEDESQYAMQTLVSSLQNRINSLNHSELNRGIQLTEVGGEVSVVNSDSGSSREYSNLSTGTREQISYAMRLEYAFRIGSQINLPFLMLDEPFRHMDNTRRDQAASYTIECLFKEKWSGCFFTFDSGLVEIVKKMAEKREIPCQVYDLTKLTF